MNSLHSESSQVLTHPVAIPGHNRRDSSALDGPMHLLATQDGSQRRIAENESMKNSRIVETNHDQPINKLPPELLFQVFDLVGPGPAILTLAQVCRWWRDVALSSPTLWSVIGASPRLVPLFIQRSLDSPLKVRGIVTHYDDREFLDCLTHLEAVIHRIVSFAVDFDERVHEPFAHLTYSAPALERLFIMVPPHSAMSTPQMLSTLFGGGMPSLRDLVLERCLPGPNCLSSSITSLTLANLSDLDGCDNLLSILESCANVEVLTLLNAIPDKSSSTPGPSSDLHVRLACLRELYVHDVSIGIQGVSNFLSHLSFPMLVNSGAYLAIIGWGVGNVGAFTSSVTTMFPQLLTGLSIAEDTLCRQPLRVKGIVGNEVVFSIPSARALDLGSLSLVNVCTLTLGPSRRRKGTHSLGSDIAWEKLFSSLQALHTLVLYKMALSPPLDGICRVGRIPNVPDCLPHLRHLVLDGCTKLERPLDSKSEMPQVALRRFLRHRAYIENPIASVKCYCGSKFQCKEMEAELRALVPSVECVIASLTTQVVIPRRVRETMSLVRYRSFGEVTFT